MHGIQIRWVLLFQVIGSPIFTDVTRKLAFIKLANGLRFFQFCSIKFFWSTILNAADITMWMQGCVVPNYNPPSSDNSWHCFLQHASLVAPLICGHSLELLLCVLQSSPDDSKDRVAVVSNSNPPIACHEHQQIQAGKRTEKRAMQCI